MAPESPRANGRAAGAGRSAADRLMLGLDLLLALALGAAHSLPMASPQAWWLQIVCVGGLAYRVGVARPGRAAALGLSFGTAWLAASVWWLFISMHRYGGLSAGLSVLAVLALSLFLSLYLAAAMALFARLRRNRPLLDALIFGGCWLLAELARGVIFTGFPWAAAGYAHTDGPLAKLAPLVGVYGIGLASAVLGAFAVLRLRRKDGRLIGVLTCAVVLIGLGLTPFAPSTVASGTLQLSLLQPNVPQEQKFDAAHVAQVLEWVSERMLTARGDLVIAPETVVPLLPEQVPPAYWNALQSHFQGGAQAALFGMPQGNATLGYTNSAVGLSSETSKSAPQGVYRYDKYHLVPFGEFIPLGFRWFTNLLHIPLGDFNRGPRVAPSFVVKGERVAPTICYEDLFGEEIAGRFSDVASAPTVLANLSNIGWFGETIAVGQHLQISRMRALEFERPMVRSTNTGTTAVIDHTGRVTESLRPHSRGVLETSVQGRHGLTPFAAWASHFGLWPLWLAAALPMLMALPLRRRNDPD